MKAPILQGTLDLFSPPPVPRTGIVAVDLFAGWGGFTEGAELAGVEVAWAANHWPLAVHAHQINHPRTKHECQDLRQADWTRLPRYDLLLASPACQGHSSASQPNRIPKHDDDRATAWAVIDCAEVTSPRAIIVENVPDFRRNWVLYPLWREALVRLGYHVQEYDAHATAFGVPQRRERLIIFATRKPVDLELPSRPEIEPAFGPYIEFDHGAWRSTTKAKPNARARFARGRANYGRTFLSQHVTNHPGVPLNQPIRTITTKDQWVIVDGNRYRPLTIREYARAMSFRDSYGWPTGITRSECIRGIGNAVPPKLARGCVSAVARIL